jgi:hypothetical protein
VTSLHDFSFFGGDICRETEGGGEALALNLFESTVLLGDGGWGWFCHVLRAGVAADAA